MTLRDCRALRARKDVRSQGRKDVRAVVASLVTIFALSGCAPEPAVNVHLEGTLVWNDEQQTLSVCDGSATYLLRIVASNPSFYVYYRVQELEAHNPGQTIIATVEGVVKPVPTPAPSYPVDGALFVNRIHGLETGACQ